MSASIPREFDHDVDQAAAADRSEQCDGSRTPTQRPWRSADTPNLSDKPLPTANTTSSRYPYPTSDAPITRPTPASSIRSTSFADDSTLAPSTYAPSTVNGYTPSTTGEHAALLPNQRLRPRFASAPQLQNKKTKSRRAFVGLCEGIELMVPIEINYEATSMRESSLGGIAQAVQGLTQKRKSARVVHGSGSNGAVRSAPDRKRS